MTTKKSRALTILLILGIVMMAAGGYFLLQIGKSHIGANGSGVSRASTSIEFGADFYTTSAQYSGLAANALIDLYDLAATGMGAFFVLGGAAVICASLAMKKRESDAAKAAETAETLT